MRRAAAAVCAGLLAAVSAAGAPRPDLAARFPRPSVLPLVTASVPESQDGRVAPGRPFSVRVLVSHPSKEPNAAPITIQVPEKADWRSLIRLDVRNDRHERVSWPLRADPSNASATVTIPPGKPVTVDYTLDAAAAAAIPSGSYTIDVVMTAGVYGKRVRAKAIALTLGEAPAAPAAPVSRPAPALAPAPADSETTLPATPPKVTVFINDSRNVEHLKGWPMIVRVTVEPGGTEPFVLSVKEGDWSKLVNMEARDADGVLQEWTFERSTLAEPARQVRIDAKNPATATFLVSGRSTGAAAPGEYKLRAVLAMGSTGKLVRSQPASIDLAEHPESLDDDQSSRRDKLMAVYHALRGEKQEALRSAERVQAAPAAVVPDRPAQAAPPSVLPEILAQFGAGAALPDFAQGSVDPSEMIGAFAGGMPDAVEDEAPEPQDSDAASSESSDE